MFTFDYDETGQGTTPVKSSKVLTIQLFDTVNTARIVQPLSLFVSSSSIVTRRNTCKITGIESISIRRLAKGSLESLDSPKKSIYFLSIDKQSEPILIRSSKHLKSIPLVNINHPTESISIQSSNYLKVMPRTGLDVQNPATVCSISPSKQEKSLITTDSRLRNELSIESQCKFSVVSEKIKKNNQNQVEYNEKRGKIKNFSLYSENYSRDPVKDFFILVLFT